ncbi:hypothetical protein CMO96_02880 [Candidatus Woesebacteria bacterium]|nr:hypothetical protein [Candidatus Woesebacteria bacterium]|tara:strand:- start:121 stop:1569 length:1449 start_codon:yes stop_codon:yes gene_type:complete
MTKLLAKNVVQYFLVFLIVGVALALRLYKIDNPIADWHSWRQADTASVSYFFVQSGIDFAHPRYHDISSVATSFENPSGWRFVEFPIFNAIHAALFNTLPYFSFDKWGRLTSVIASLVSVVFMFLLGRRFISPIGGLLAASFFAILPFNIYFSRVVLPEPLAVASALAALWFFVLWIDRQKLLFILFSGVLFATALLVKPFTIFYALPMLYLALAKFGIVGMLKRAELWFFLSLSLTPFFVWRAWMWNEDFLRGIPHFIWVFNGDDIRFKPSFWWWIFSERLGRLILGTWLAILFAIGLAKKFSKPGSSWFIHFFLLGQFLYVSIVATASVRHDYYQTLIIPAVSLALAGGSIALWNITSLDTKLRRLLVIGSVCMGLVFSFYQVREFYKINHPEIVRAGQAVDKLIPKDALILAPYNGDTAFLYQTRRSGWPHITLPIDQMIERFGARYYVSVNFDQQTKDVMAKYQVLEKTDEYVVVKLR